MLSWQIVANFLTPFCATFCAESLDILLPHYGYLKRNAVQHISRDLRVCERIRSLVCIVVVVLCVLLSFCVCLLYYVCVAVYTLDAGLLARSQYSEGPATGHLDTGFSWFPCVYKQMLRWFPTLQVATTCFSCSPPDLNLVVTNFIFSIHVK